MNRRIFTLIFTAPWVTMTLSAAHAQADMQLVGRFDIDRTEVTIGQFRHFVNATKTVTQAEKTGGGSTFENGWEQRRGWVWRAPFGQPGADDEPVAHVTFDEAQRFCQWSGRRLPTDAEWGEAAYVERREKTPAGFVTGQRYRYPTGDSPLGANCLGDCGSVRTVGHAVTSRGSGHARVATTAAGVNGLFDMGGNLWEWVDSNAGGSSTEKRTRGGSWWYGAEQMRDDHVQSKTANTAVVYIGFRCARDRK
jgi:formylglycine-generating enzyme